MLTEADLDVKLDFDSVRAAGSFLGAGGLIVLDETVDIVEVMHIIERFLWNESCGQCTPCREGSGWITRILGRVLDGKGIPEDLDNIQRVGENITGKVICALGDTVGMVATSTLKKFRPEFEKRIQGGRP
jgi:NADH-quinone oxidoreductase subunit F